MKTPRYASKDIPRASWSPGEFAERHGFSRAFIYKLIESGRLRSVLAGNRRLITLAHEAEWLAMLEREAGRGERDTTA